VAPYQSLRFLSRKSLKFACKHKFETLLKKNGILFNASRAKGFEEIQGIKNNAAVWRLKGTWYGYDLFHSTKELHLYIKYRELLKQQKHTRADRVAGELYGYPTKAVEAFAKTHNSRALARKYTYYQYYKRMHDSDIAFPFITHVPSTPKSVESKKLNDLYKRTVKKHAPAFYKEYTKKRKYKVPVIVDTENTIPGIWKTRTAHDYVVITTKPIEGKYWLISWLTKKEYKRGTILDTTITIQYDYASITVNKELGRLPKFHHERHFTKL